MRLHTEALGSADAPKTAAVPETAVAPGVAGEPVRCCWIDLPGNFYRELELMLTDGRTATVAAVARLARACRACNADLWATLRLLLEYNEERVPTPEQGAWWNEEIEHRLQQLG